MKTLGIIPARYQSSRFPGKPLHPIAGKPMIQWVYEHAAAARSIDALVVATDDRRILEAVRSFGGKATMTSPDHNSGTSRCWEAAERYSGYELVFNIQGDEPLIDPGLLDDMIERMKREGCRVLTAANVLDNPADIGNPNIVKVVFDTHGRAMYFSRLPIPYQPAGKEIIPGIHFRHLGLYLFQWETLGLIPQLPPSRLEDAERLEQLKWMDHGIDLFVWQTDYPGMGVDHPEDVERVEAILGSDL